MTETPAQFPNAAQVARHKAEVAEAIKQALTAMNLRIRAVELAAHFSTPDPATLAKELYEFIKQDE